MFCYEFNKTHCRFGCDLQNRFEENAKEMRYCTAELNVISEGLRDEEGGLSKTITNRLQNTFNDQNFQNLLDLSKFIIS